jgi:CheY-like chemotaxis protein
MPEMNGWELADVIREKYCEEIIIIVVSGWSINNSDMTEHGVRDSLQKPFSLAHLKEVLEKLD